MAYGTNDAARSDFSADYRSNVTGFINNLRNLYPTQHIYMITPLWSNWGDRAPNLEESRTIIEEVAEGFDNISIINGLDMVPNESGNFPDNLHPGDTGSAIYAQNIANAIN